MSEQSSQQQSASADATSADNEQPLVAHLLELRTRLLRSIGATLLVFLSLVYFSNDIYSFVALPIQNLLPEGSTMIATDVASPFFAPFKLTLILSFFIAVPYVLFQLWSFIAPGLYSNEKKLAIPLFVSSVLLFYLGIAFSYYVVFPIVFGFFTSIAPTGIAVTPDISSYLSFILKLFFAFGLAFEIPIATFILIRAGVTTRQTLAEKRPYIVVMCFVFGMLLTPPDIVSQSLLAIPAWLLFEVGLLMSRLVENKAEDKSEQAQER